jgi:hypothetical protein
VESGILKKRGHLLHMGKTGGLSEYLPGHRKEEKYGEVPILSVKGKWKE